MSSVLVIGNNRMTPEIQQRDEPVLKLTMMILPRNFNYIFKELYMFGFCLEKIHFDKYELTKFSVSITIVSTHSKFSWFVFMI